MAQDVGSIVLAQSALKSPPGAGLKAIVTMFALVNRGRTVTSMPVPVSVADPDSAVAALPDSPAPARAYGGSETMGAALSYA
ncbi:MAG: hypothetical protein ACO3PB_07970 [Miltoncostaeaceae bacterium]